MKDTKNYVYFGIVVVLIIIGGYFFVKSTDTTPKPKEEAPTPVTIGEKPAEAVDQTATTQPETKPLEKKALPITNTTKKYMNNSDVTKLDIQTTHEGTGTVSKSGDTLSMNYTGKLLNGTKFDSNVDPAFHHVQPFTFKLGAGQVIKGWDQGLVGMKVGEKRTLTIPADMAYGAYSPSPAIPANSALVFDVELLKIN